MANTGDILQSPELRRRTARVLALKERMRRAQKRVSSLVADIGDELAAAKAAIDRAKDKKTWLRWLAAHVRFAKSTAENMMAVAGLRKRFPNVWESWSRLPPSLLYLIAALPDEIAGGLTPESRLRTAPGGAAIAVEDMSARQLGRALALLRGRTGKRGAAGGRAAPPPENGAEARARSVLRKARALLPEILAVNAGEGKLTPQTKRDMMDEVEDLREATLHWKAWVTPRKGGRSSRG